jgi:hypothetical protein
MTNRCHATQERRTGHTDAARPGAFDNFLQRPSPSPVMQVSETIGV